MTFVNDIFCVGDVKCIWVLELLNLKFMEFEVFSFCDCSVWFGETIEFLCNF